MPNDDTTMPGPLAGLRVLELATLYGVPAAGAMLGDLGADVVKVEPLGGEPFRIMSGAAGVPEAASGWTLVGRNKRMVTIDAGKAEGVALLGDLTRKADIILSNQPVKVLERWHCTYEEIAQRNPAAVMAHVTGWGLDGPYAQLGGNGSVSEAFAGLTHLIRGADGDPHITGALIGDYLAALSVVVGTMAACYARDANGGTGQLVDVAMYEAIVSLIGPQIVSWNPDADQREPQGGLRGTYRCGDGSFVVIGGASGGQIPRLLVELGLGDGVPDDVNAFAADWIADHTRDEVVAAFREARVPIGPVNDIGALLADAHVRARASITEIEDAHLGTVSMPTPTPRLTATPASIRSTPGPAGCDNAEVYAEWLGLSDAAIAELRTAEII